MAHTYISVLMYVYVCMKLTDMDKVESFVVLM